MTGWVRDLLLGARLALADGRRSAGRLALAAVATGLGVAVLLLAASVPHMWSAREQRQTAMGPVTVGTVGQPTTDPLPAGTDPLYLVDSGTQFRGTYIRGWYLLAGGPHAPVPRGVDRIPAPGELYVSPALGKLLDSPDGALLRPRFPGRVLGTIAEPGLSDPHDYRFYAGTATVRGTSATGAAYVVGGFGDIPGGGSALPPILWLLLVVGVVVLLIPVLTVIATAGRVGGPARDRRLAALRLVGAGARQTRRVAAGEALVGSVAGVVLGLVLFLVGRAVAPSVELVGFFFFTDDITPALPVAAVVLLLGPVLAVQASIFALRGAVIEPLGVVRQAGATRRRLWWRLIPLLVGAGLIGVLMTTPNLEDSDTAQVAISVSLLLIGIPVVLPWLVERLVRGLPHGSIPYELAVRRLRLDPGGPARLVGGLGVVLAGALALQTVLLAAERDTGANNVAVSTSAEAAMSAVVVDASALPQADQVRRDLTAIPGVRITGTIQQILLAPSPDGYTDRLALADCAAIAQLAPGTACTDGDVFAGQGSTYYDPSGQPARPVLMLADGTAGRPAHRWRPPATVREPRLPNQFGAYVLTPGALHGITPLVGGVEVHFSVGTSDRDTVERIRNVTGGLGWQADVVLSLGGPLAVDVSDEVKQFRTIRTALLLGSLITLLLAGASLVALALEQIAERRRPMAVLAASGVPRAVLVRSVVWQNTLPMVAAVAVALVTGVGLGQALLRLAHQRPPGLGIDWVTVVVLVGSCALLVLLTTALTLPALRRATRPTELRSE